MSIIYFVYKGEVNIQQSQLAALLKAARTLQIRGLSDTIGTIESEGSQSDFSGAKKRKICEPIGEALNDCSLSLDQSLIPKIEPQLEETFISNVSISTSDEDDLKNDSLHESLPNLLPTDSGGNTGELTFIRVVVFSDFRSRKDGGSNVKFRKFRVANSSFKY